MVTLAISTSSGQFALAFGENDKIIFNSDSLEIDHQKDISILFEEGLKYTKKTVDSIKQIVVDNGPGGTSSVRTGVAFANALAYSLKIPICSVSSLELAGIDIWENSQIPVISTVKSIKKNAFIGYFKDYNNFSLHYGKINEILPNLLKDISELAIAGHHRDEIKELLLTKTVNDTGKKFGNVELLLKKKDLFIERKIIFPELVYPVTEKSIEESEIENTAQNLINGGVALLPTDTVYGLAASPLHQKAIERIFELKQRSKLVNLPIMVASIDDLEQLGIDLQPATKRLFSSKFVPGDLTMILGFKTKPLVKWLSGREECAIRIPNDKNLLEVLKKTGPLLVTSANKHGTPITPNNTKDILDELNGEPNLVVNGGIVENVPSTIVNCRVEPPVIERTGRVSYDELFKILNDE